LALTNPQAADHIAAEAGTFEPQRQNNFKLEIPLPGTDKDYISMALHGFTLPQQTNEVVEVEFQNETRKVAGKATVEEGTMILKDFVDVDTLGAVLRWRKQVYDPQTGNIGRASDYKKTGYVILTGPDGEDERVAKLIGVWPSADPSFDMNMEGSDKILLEVPIQIDKNDWSGSIVGA
jgi:hypothetical protein